MRIATQLVVSAALTILLPRPGSPQTGSQDDVFTRWAREAAIVLPGVIEEWSGVDLDVLGHLIGEARIVAIGEATHGQPSH